MNLPSGNSYRVPRYLVRIWQPMHPLWLRFRVWLSRRICAIWEFPMAPSGNPYGYPHRVVPSHYPEWFRSLALGAPLFARWDFYSPTFGREVKHVFKGRDGVWYCRTTFTESELRKYNYDLRQVLADNAVKELQDLAIPDEIFNNL